MERKETYAEFQARMDRAREKDAGETNKAGVLGLGIYVAGVATYFYLKSSDWHGIYFLFAAVNSLLIAIATSLLVGIYRSRRP